MDKRYGGGAASSLWDIIPQNTPAGFVVESRDKRRRLAVTGKPKEAPEERRRANSRRGRKEARVRRDVHGSRGGRKPKKEVENARARIPILLILLPPDENGGRDKMGLILLTNTNIICAANPGSQRDRSKARSSVIEDADATL
ncbi:hypothetical protein KM043_005218 [Ampulex compressa]|nr:hypothetical protein KM043_005218 [Ampulex compressa]